MSQCEIHETEIPDFAKWLKSQGVARKVRANGNRLNFSGYRFTANKDGVLRFNLRTQWLGLCFNRGISIQEYRQGRRR